MSNVRNAQITGTFLGRDGHGIMTLYLTLSFDGFGCSYGGYSLDGYDKVTKKRVCSHLGMQSVCEILDTVGVDNWEGLRGQYVRVEFSCGAVTRIGHLIKDRWFSLKEFFSQEA